ncbi:MAG: hypothetical protein IPK75_11070 [Acidobacteria bacterium]|jgi:hypothetical protein|nr:hypothetical protein [Acidobacteriota bacterium]
MSASVAGAVWLALAGYLGIGLAIGAGVILFGMKRLTAAEVPGRVRLLVLPGMAALWPVILLRLIGVKPPEDRA